MTLDDRSHTAVDRWLSALDHGLRTLHGAVHAQRPSPAVSNTVSPLQLSAPDQALSASLMRVNHVGEVCAQALYQAQALTARTPELRRQMLNAAQEERDHLAWTQQRLDQLGGRPSLLNPLWYAGAFGIGLLAGRAGDATSLGFVVETERQVEQHLAGHLNRLPPQDTPSRAIVDQMRQDEAAHGEAARAAGARPLPAPLQLVMKAAAKVMTSTAHYI